MFFGVFPNLRGKYKYACNDLSFDTREEKVCPACGRSYAVSSFRDEPKNFVLDGGKAYPDFLSYTGPSGNMIPFIISARTLKLFEENGISGFVNLCKVICSVKRCSAYILDEQAPEYYLLDFLGTIDFDFKEMHLKKTKTCSACGRFAWSRLRFGSVILDKSSWNGMDICRLASVPNVIVCTEKVEALARKNKLTGLIFQQEQDILSQRGL